MRVYFRNDDGKFITRAEFVVLEKEVAIPEVTTDYTKAEQRLEELRSVDVDTAAMICAVDPRTTKQKVEGVYNIASGGVRIMSDRKHEEKSVFDAFCETLKYRLKKQEKIVQKMHDKFDTI
jgi:hypothetical protein